MYPDYLWVFGFLVGLDVSSHYFMMVATYTKGGDSHKMVSKDDNALLHLYYSNKLFMVINCAGAEVLYIALYVVYYTHGAPLGFDIGPLPTAQMGWCVALAYLMAPFCALKQVINLVQLKFAGDVCIEYEFKKDQKKN